VCSEKVLDSRPGDHLPGTDVLTRHPFFLTPISEATVGHRPDKADLSPSPDKEYADSLYAKPRAVLVSAVDIRIDQLFHQSIDGTVSLSVYQLH
jgi:hypothetical protein